MEIISTERKQIDRYMKCYLVGHVNGIYILLVGGTYDWKKMFCNFSEQVTVQNTFKK